MSSDIENQQKNNNETNNINNDISLELAKKKLKLANFIHRDFVKDVALNIKDPSTGIFEHSVAQSSAENDPLKKQSINDITDCAAELMDYSQEIIVDFIDYHSSLMDSTNTVLVPKIFKKFNPRKLVNRIITKLTPTANYKGIQLVSSFYRDITPIITGDSYRIEAILMQLVSNALKFTNKGGVFVLTSHAPRILESQNDDNEETTEEKESEEAILQFIVHDTGIGMSLDKQQYLYEQLNKTYAMRKKMVNYVEYNLQMPRG
ncbi:hypothetical protein [Candidatus Tisiphia endosymbiont of Ditula angustiorana]|uniref:sensor histidine kinase n=1 Tax=Candidatus Tisiphia endosymbiont of Ditula angustiorana TaxID=3066272 RepID=UPI00312CA759